MLSWDSIFKDSRASLNLRDTLRSRVKKKVRATCWVMVEPPCKRLTVPSDTIDTAARATAIGSTPGCW